MPLRGDLPRLDSSAGDGAPPLLEHGVNGTLRDQVTAALVLAGLQLPAVDHLPDAPIRDLQDAGRLASCVFVLLHCPPA